MIRVAITTDRFEEVAPFFRRLGLEPVWLPCIRLGRADDVVLARAREAASSAELLLISSSRTLDLLWPDGSMPAVDVAAVGEQTAAAVEAWGGRVILSGRSGLTHLVAQMTDRLASSRVVFPHAAGTDPMTLERIREQATNLDEFEIYRTVAVAPESTQVQAAVFGSPSAVDGWLISRDFDRLVVAVIGPTTWEAVARHRPPEVVAAQPTYQALARSLSSYLEVAV